MQCPNCKMVYVRGIAKVPGPHGRAIFVCACNAADALSKADLAAVRARVGEPDRLTATIPAVKVTERQRAQIDDALERDGRTISEVVRTQMLAWAAT